MKEIFLKSVSKHLSHVPWPLWDKFFEAISSAEKAPTPLLSLHLFSMVSCAARGSAWHPQVLQEHFFLPMDTCLHPVPQTAVLGPPCWPGEHPRSWCAVPEGLCWFALLCLTCCRCSGCGAAGPCPSSLQPWGSTGKISSPSSFQASVGSRETGGSVQLLGVKVLQTN